ncbi:hypothetical protein CKAN_02578700 [Cinnamomum micranthum f. kanehirae]|uniref:Uncharacterized protein n=1 Tax=Cinnamomum micranthum f. kanehirae TaxID=337451 RepID=A0A3S3R9A6_9MAGN|nr:hypothetical protein CKAN_02578700 [Cinnamomum micranthum f. kanehirae]
MEMVIKIEHTKAIAHVGVCMREATPAADESTISPVSRGEGEGPTPSNLSASQFTIIKVNFEDEDKPLKIIKTAKLVACDVIGIHMIDVRSKWAE